jgi:uncharacterized membrane protein
VLVLVLVQPSLGARARSYVGVGGSAGARSGVVGGAHNDADAVPGAGAGAGVGPDAGVLVLVLVLLLVLLLMLVLTFMESIHIKFIKTYGQHTTI